MADRIPEYELKEFMTVLYRIQTKINKKHGQMTIYKWRQKRLEREKTWI